MLSSIKERQPVLAGNALTFLIVFSTVVFPLTFKCVSWSKVLSQWAGDVLISTEQRQCRFILCLSTNLVYQLA